VAVWEPLPTCLFDEPTVGLWLVTNNVFGRLMWHRRSGKRWFGSCWALALATDWIPKTIWRAPLLIPSGTPGEHMLGRRRHVHVGDPEVYLAILICYQTPVFGLMSEGTEKKLHYFFDSWLKPKWEIYPRLSIKSQASRRNNRDQNASSF